MNGKYEDKGLLVAKLIMDDKLNQIKQNERERLRAQSQTLQNQGLRRV